jgi:hypothetical protein
MDVEDDPLELAGPGLLMLPELFCLIIANALEEAIFDYQIRCIYFVIFSS